MFGGGKGMAGRGLRVVGRAVTTAANTTRTGVTNLQEPLPSSSSSTAVTSPKQSRSSHKPNLTLSSSTAAAATATATATACPFSAAPPPTYSWPSTRSSCDEFEWVSVDGPGHESEDYNPFGLLDDFAFSPPVPSLDEVHSAVSTLSLTFDAPSYSQLVRDRFSSSRDSGFSDQISSPNHLLRRDASASSELDWMEPSPYLCNYETLHPYGPQRVFDAFHLLQTDPSVQRMVISLSSDEAVWDAVLNNSVVRELWETYYEDESISAATSEVSDENRDESNQAMNFVRWIFGNTRAKVVELIETLTKLVNQLVKPPYDEQARGGGMDHFDEKLRASFMLSTVVLLIVVVTRASRG